MSEVHYPSQPISDDVYYRSLEQEREAKELEEALKWEPSPKKEKPNPFVKDAMGILAMREGHAFKDVFDVILIKIHTSLVGNHASKMEYRALTAEMKLLQRTTVTRSQLDGNIRALTEATAEHIRNIHDCLDHIEKTHRLDVGSIVTESQAACKASANASLNLVKEFCARFVEGSYEY